MRRVIVVAAALSLMACGTETTDGPGTETGPDETANNGGRDSDIYNTPSCNYQDNPEACDDWVCYTDERGTVCERSRPDRPDGEDGWICDDDVRPGYTTCWRDDDTGGGGGRWDCYDDADGTRHCTTDDPGGGDEWDCEFTDDGTICHRDDDARGGDGWECFDDANGTTCTSDDPENRNDTPDGGDWECVTDGDTRICHEEDDGRPDTPDGGDGWDCYDDADGRHCSQDDTPDGGDDWDCTTDGDTLDCTREDNPDGGGDEWDCEYDADNNREICTDEPDTPTDDPGWDCWEEEDRRICTQEGHDDPDEPILTDCGDPTGNINGRLCAPSGQHWVVGGTVTVTYQDCNNVSHTVSTQTDAEGYFVLVGVGEGTHNVHAEKGPYQADFEVTVTAGQTSTIPLGDFCFDQSTNIAVVTGEYDQVELVLDHLGFTYDLYEGFPTNNGARELLGDLGRMNDYDVIFMDCGTVMQGIFDNRQVLDAIRSNIDSYVSTGGRLYVSDWDWMFVEEPFPDYLDFHGQDDRALFDVLSGAQGYSVAKVEDSELAAALGEDRVTIQFDYPDWAVVDAAREGVRVFLSADVNTTRGALLRDVPVLMSFKKGEGEVIYTSYHIHQNEAVNQIFTYTVLGFE